MSEELLVADDAAAGRLLRVPLSVAAAIGVLGAITVISLSVLGFGSPSN